MKPRILRRLAPVCALTAVATLTLVTPASAAETGQIMPDFRGKSLNAVYQTLGRTIQIVTKDASPKGRNILWPLNWVVCTQDPAAGTNLADFAITTFTAVKTDEKCP
ncbi:hypothetical protein JOF53_004962 [Crossiella equi]|uniref:PASTA domain-containing protein n=1 Tax=Crossiella equi TaxID=130796 RepID=A0ABS5AHN1_9PSEU|nr:PASTA domain-containing protein [Crossiella equi]MBP2476090.1 hypothetical protein [Crossiella equi]